MMKRSHNSKAITDTTAIAAGEKDRSININCHLFRSLFSDIIFITLIISGILSGFIQESTASPLIASRADVTTTYSGAVSSGQSFLRPDGYPDEYYYFHAIQVSISTSGIYTFTSHSDIDTVGYLYTSPFDPSNPSANLVTDDDDSSDDDLQFLINVYLLGGQTYILVVTTHWDLITGDFLISTVGPTSVGFMSITPSTSRPIIIPTTSPTVSSVYSSALSFSSQAFERPNGDTGGYYYFQAIQISISTAGSYVFTSDSDMDTVGYLHNSPFDPSNPSANLITYDDDDGDSILQFRIEADLQGGQTYILVVTTHRDSVIGSFSISAVGPASVSLISITPSTSQPILITTTEPSVTSIYSNELSSNSEIFVRPDSFSTSSYYYFQAIQVIVPTAGTYIFRSNSTIDTKGYFYDSPFDPSNATVNLITSNDDTGGQLQFRIQVYLRTGRTYILVVTTHRDSVTGNYSVSAAGPASASLMSITPSTSRPIRTSTIPMPISASYAGELSSTSPIFYRPQNNTNDYHYFQALQVTVSTAGTYVFRSQSTIDTRAYFYDSPFDPSTSAVNLIADNDDGGGQLQFRIEIYLVPGRTYVLVVTTHRQYVMGNYSVTAAGFGAATLTAITSSTSQPITIQPTTPSIQSSYAGELSIHSPIFYRPQSHTNDYHYFQAIQVTVPTNGTYIFKSNSTIDTRGYFYRTSFDPSNSTGNLMTDNDDGAGERQFLIQVSLESGQTYVLVVTTHREYVMGAFSVLAAGPASASLTSITPSTSRPITTRVTTPAVSSSYTGALLSSSQIFTRPQDTTQRLFYYQAIQVTTSTAGTYALTSSSSMDTRGYLYRDSFDPSNSTINLIADNDDGATQLQFRIQIHLQSDQIYILVVTTHRENVTGSFSVSAVGPGRVDLVAFTPTTRPPPTTTTTISYITTSHLNALVLVSPTFYRPNGERKNYYYETIGITVISAGNFSISSNAYIDTVGYLYDNSFDPLNPSVNLITSDDNSGFETQFLINTILQSGRTYILVVTTSQPSITGVFWLSVVGLTRANVTAIPSTGVTPINPTISTRTSTMASGLSIRISPGTTGMMCMLIMSMLRMFQQHRFE